MKLIKFLKPYVFFLVLLILFTLGQVAANLELPDYTAQIINNGIIGGEQEIILPIGVKMLFVALIGGVCTVIAGYLSAKVGTGMARGLRKDIFEKVESFSLSEINTFTTSSLITRSTNDVQQLQVVVVMILRMVTSAPITAVWAIYKAIQIAPDMSWIMALAVGALTVIIFSLSSIVIPRFQSVQKLTDKLNLVVRENLNGIRVIRAFNNEKVEEKRLLEVNEDLTNLNLFVSRAMALMQPLMFLILNLVSVSTIWFGAHLVVEFQLGIGDMLAFIQYAIQVIISFLLISMVFIMIPRALVSARRISEVLVTKPEIQDPEKAETPDKNNGIVEFKDVTFGYNKADVPVLENISFTAHPGKVTAIIGSTGSGKSTLINLIPRFYDVLYGEIQIDGINIKDLTQKKLRSKIGYIPQKSVLFSGTIASNISYGASFDDKKLISRAAQIAQASDFIEKFPEKYETPVSQNGTNLSGGQKQRISIARAIAKDPEIYIFDDSFSALDFRTDMKLRHALSREVKDKTVIIVAQRVSTIINADQIVVLDRGRVVGIGKHEDLIKTCEVYIEIAKSQLSETELKKYL